MTDHQRDLLVSAYMTAGYPAAQAYAIEQGISPRYIAKLLRKRGIKNTSRKGPKRPHRCNTHNDPRWARAIAVGPVLA